MGARVRHARRDRGLTLQALADRSGVSRAMLSKVERGEKSPTIRVAKLIAAALDISLSVLADDGQEPPDSTCQIIRSDTRSVFRDASSGFVRTVLIPDDGSGTEFVRHDLPAGVTTEQLPAQPTGSRKRVIVEAGRLELTIADTRYLLESGDAISFAADRPHGFANAGAEPCRYILAISVPR